MKNGEVSTRERMVRATCELLEAQGYHATGLNEILQRSDAPRGSLYYYFPEGKEELAIEAIECQGRFVEDRLREDLAVDADVSEAVRGIFHRLAHYAEASGCRALSPITAVALESSATNERLRQACAAAYESWQAAIVERFLASGFEQAHAQSLSIFVLSALEGATTLTRALHSADPLRETGDQLAHLLKLAQTQ